MIKISHCLLAVVSFCFLGCSEPVNSKYDNAASAPQATSNANQMQQSASTAALNPEHGQPGHRCDIPVGTPLDAPAQPSLNVPPTFTPPPSQNTVVAAGTNPPHGQPGHDCSIAVGAPLNK